MKHKISAALSVLFAALLVAVALTLPAPASADLAPGESVWKTKAGSSILNENMVALNGGNTSVETEDLGINLTDETTVTFVYSLDGSAECVGGAPRVFLKVGDVYVNSWDQLIGTGAQCGTPIEDLKAGKVTFTAPAGEVTHAGVVYDNGKAGTIFISELVIGEGLVNFKERVPVPTSAAPTTTPSSPAPTPTVTVAPTGTGVPPTTAPATQSPSPTQTTSSPAAPQPCEAYVYTGTTENLCADFPGNVESVDCADVQYQVTLVDSGVDPWGLDANGQGTLGVGCESNPLKPTDEPTITTSPVSGVGGGDLALTGGKPLAVGGLGAVILAVGAALLVLARRRRDEEEAGPETA